MGRADPAGRKHVIEFPADFVDGGDDDRRVVGDDPRLAQPDPGLAQPGREESQVRVLGASRQDLVADDQDAGGHHLGCRLGLAHRILGLVLRLNFAATSYEKARRAHNKGRLCAGKDCRGGLCFLPFGSGSGNAGRCRLLTIGLSPERGHGTARIEQRALGYAAGPDAGPGPHARGTA